MEKISFSDITIVSYGQGHSEARLITFSKGGGPINVSCENVDKGVKDTPALEDGKYVKISIEDQGPGIPEEDLVKIFDPYFSTKELGTQKGMGLGLS